MKEQLLQFTRRGELWKPEGNQGVHCFACGHRCFIPLGRDGICKVRSNIGGELKVPWGYVAGLQADSVEKKPFFHVLPGSTALSFGMLGCDFHCSYCQNWFTSQTLRDPKATAPARPVAPNDIFAFAEKCGAKILTSTYNEPLITSEWAVEIFRKAKPLGFRTSYVSNGNATPEVLGYIRPYVDFYKIDLKSFSDKHYRELGGVLKNVTDSISQVYKLGFWLEIVTLLIPGFNDEPTELRELAQFLASVSVEIPWHVTAYHQDYKMRDRDETTRDHLIRAGEIGKEAGLKFVYLGNLPGQVGDWENTRCPMCRDLLIERRGFTVLQNRISEGCCPKCRAPIPGVWS